MTGGSISGRGKWIHSGAPTKPYYVAFWKAVMSAIEVRNRDDWKLQFVFDQQHTLAPLALRLYQRLKNELDEPESLRMGDARYASRHEAIGLQAADLLAHCWYQFGLYGHVASAEVHQVLSAQRRDTLVVFTKEMMDKLVGRTEPSPGNIYMYDPRAHAFRPQPGGS